MMIFQMNMVIICLSLVGGSKDTYMVNIWLIYGYYMVKPQRKFRQHFWDTWYDM